MSFASSLQVDLDAGFGAFASSNAQLGFRPEPVTEYALRLLHNQSQRTQLPGLPAFDESARVVNATDYIGRFWTRDGRAVEIKLGRNGALDISAQGVTGTLQHTEGDAFIADHPKFDLFPVVFGRTAVESITGAAVTDLAYGPDWYINSRYQGPESMPPSKDLEQYVGTYYTENPWYDTARVVQRQGQLWMGGDTLLAPIGNRLYRIGEDPHGPELVEFADFVNGRANTLRFWGVDMRRIG